MTPLIVFLGGGLGALARYVMTAHLTKAYGNDFPWGTLAVNLLGAFLMGLIVELLALKINLPAPARSFLTTGILGGFTTFSAFTLETGLMIDRGAYGALFAYIGLSVFGGIALFLMATAIIRAL